MIGRIYVTHQETQQDMYVTSPMQVKRLVAIAMIFHSLKIVTGIRS